MSHARKVETLRTAYICKPGEPCRFPNNRQDTYSNRQHVVRVVTVHTRHKADANGNRYRIDQTATASNPDALRSWVASTPGEFSADGLTYTRTTEI